MPARRRAPSRIVRLLNRCISQPPLPVSHVDAERAVVADAMEKARKFSIVVFSSDFSQGWSVHSTLVDGRVLCASRTRSRWMCAVLSTGLTSALVRCPRSAAVFDCPSRMRPLMTWRLTRWSSTIIQERPGRIAFRRFLHKCAGSPIMSGRLASSLAAILVICANCVASQSIALTIFTRRMHSFFPSRQRLHGRKSLSHAV